MINKKSQSAMEYLMTYGWAILVVLIALGALFYLGVFNPKTSNSCIASSPITCTDVLFDQSANTLTLVLGATGTSSAQIGAETISTPTGKDCVNPVSVDISTANPTSMAWTVCDLVAGDVGDRFAGTVAVTYTTQGSDIVHTATVQISGTVEA